MNSFTCEKCYRIFTTKTSYKRHSQRKTPCYKTKLQSETINIIIDTPLSYTNDFINETNNTFSITIYNEPTISELPNIKKYGQYFTTCISLKEKVLEFILNKPDIILEPSIGRGDLVDYIQSKLENTNFHMYEIDKSIKLLPYIKEKNVFYKDFLNETITHKYSTIIGNPPYVKTKKGNLYIQFIEKCVNILEENGELIFIVPSDFLKLTSASKLLNFMIQEGTFTHIYHPHNEALFKYATIDIIVFRYCKNKAVEKKVLYNNKSLYIQNTNGLITFDQIDTRLIPTNPTNKYTFNEYFDIYVGIVSGKEDVYKNKKLGNIEVLNGESKIDKYIYIRKYPCDCEEINTYLLEYKDVLISRKIRKFNDKNWFEWGALRNIKSVEKYVGEECIYISTLTRKSNVAFRGKVCYFGGSLIMLKPKIKCNLDKIISYLNSNEFKNNFLFSGRFKIGHRCISNSIIPIDCL